MREKVTTKSLLASRNSESEILSRSKAANLLSVTGPPLFDIPLLDKLCYRFIDETIIFS